MKFIEKIVGQISFDEYIRGAVNSEGTARVIPEKIEDRRRDEILSLTADEIIKRNSKLIRKIISDKVWTTQADASFDKDDLFQIGCIALAEKYKLYNGQTEFSTFTYTCVVNAIRTYISANKHTMSFDERVLVDDKELESKVDSVSSYETFEEDVEAKIEADEMYDTIRSLYNTAKPATKRNILIFLKRFEGSTIEELAKEYNISTDKVSTWIGEGKRYLANNFSL